MEKEKVRLLAIQVESIIGEYDLNIDTCKNLICANIEKYNGADILFLPEVWTVGWEPSVFADNAETLENSRAVKMLKEIAQKHSVNIVGGSFIRKSNDGKLYNTCPVINRSGEVIAKYDKNHLYSYYGADEGKYNTAGDNPVMVDIEGVKLGLTICYDIRFPEIYRAYRKSGADILVNVAAWAKSKKIPWESMVTSRAVENQSYMVAINQTGLLADGTENLGDSMIINYEGKILDKIDENEGGIYAEINLNEMYAYREKCTILNDIKKSYEVISL